MRVIWTPALPFAALAALALLDCRTATSLRVAAFSEVDCAARARVALVVGRSSTELRDVSAVSTRCGPAGAPFQGAFDTGSVVLAPDDTDAPVLLQLMTRPDGESPDTCLDPAQASKCIIARRRVGFASREELYVPIELRFSCLGITCGPEETCRRGACVAAAVPEACATCNEDTLSGTSLPLGCGKLAGLEPGALWPMAGFCASRPGRSGRNGPTTPNVRFRFPLGDIASMSPAIAADGTIYAASNADVAFAIRPDGQERWRAQLDGNVNSSGFVVATDGTVHVGTSRGTVYALGASTGAVRWQRNLAVDIALPPAVAGDGALLFASAGDTPALLFALSPASGDVLWQSAALAGTGGPTVTSDGTIYAAGLSAQLQALRSSDGSVLRSTQTPRPTRTPVAADDRTIYVDDDDTLLAVKPDGTLAWTRPVGRGGAGLALAANGTIIVTSGKSLSAISPTGDVVWTRTDVPELTDSVVLGGDGTIYVGGTDAAMHAFAADGTPRWSVATGGTVFEPGAIGLDGTLYVVSTDGNLYAIGP